MTIFSRLFKRKRQVLFAKTDLYYLVPGLAAFIIITLWAITKSSIWFDEAFGAYIIRFNFFDIARYTASDVHPPLYYWLLKPWGMIFGNTELGLRSMSLFFGVIAIIIGYFLVKKLFDAKAARVGLLFMVLSPMLVRYNQEARMYTLVAAIALAATYVLTIAIESKKRWPWVVYGILVSLGMWTHYFAAIVWLAHWVWRADVIRRSARKGQFMKKFFSREWIMAHLIAIGLFLPWLPFFVSQLFVIQAFGFWIPPVTPGTPINFMTNAVYYQDIDKVTGWMTFAFLAMVTILGILAFKVYKAMNNAMRQNYRLIIALAFVPMMLLIMLSMPPLRSSFIDRYLITSVVAMALFIGITFIYGAKYLGAKWKIIIPAILAVMLVIGISNVYYFGNYNKNSHATNETRQIVQAAAAKSSDNEPIIAATPWLFYEAVFYSTDSHPVFYIDPINYQFGSLAMLKDNAMFKITDIKQFEKDHPNFWYIGYSTEGKLDAPYSNWEPIQTVAVDDAIDGGPAYKAIEFKTTN